MNRASDQIGVEEIRRRVAAAISTVDKLALPADGKQPTVRELAMLVRERLDDDTLDAIQREGLVRIVRRVRRLKRNQPTRIKRSQKPRG